MKLDEVLMVTTSLCSIVAVLTALGIIVYLLAGIWWQVP